MIILKSNWEIEAMRRAGEVVALTLMKLMQAVRIGITTLELDKVAEEFIRSRGGVPAFKGYYGFPANICVSVNEEVVHGIPSQRKLKSGDIVSIDVGVLLDGFYGDGAVTVPVGKISPEAEKLLAVTQEALVRGISQARVGNRLGDISSSIQTWVESCGFNVVRTYVGHGIGRSMHEDPPVPNFGEPGTGPLLREGMTLAIEPMVNAGGYEVVVDPVNNWTVTTKDGSLSAHFEHTVVITNNGPEVLTVIDSRGPAW